MAARHQVPPSSYDYLRVKGAQEYANLVSAHARQATADALHPGQNYENLSQYLLQPYQSRAYQERSERAGDAEFAILYDLGVDIPQRITRFHHVEAFDTIQHIGASETGHILFLRGNPTPEWLNTIGYKCNVDPEFFLRHLDFRSKAGKPDYFHLPCLPSSNNNFVKLCWTTIGFRTTFEGHRKEQDRIEHLRRETATKMAQYLDEIRFCRGMKTCDSFVRRFAVHDEAHFSFEQEVSISVNMIGKSWVVIIWQDVGNDLTEGPKGPWLESLRHASYTWTTRTLPTIQYKPYMALEARFPPTRSNSEGPNPRKFTQSSALVSMSYGKSLDDELMSSDPFYALTELFSFTAFSEVQFLNMMETKLKQEADFSVISNLLYNKKVLDQHVQNIGETLSYIKLYEESASNQLSPVPGSPQERSSAATKQLLKDFEYLHDRARNLSAYCDRGMNIVMNNNMLLESQRAIKQAAGVAKLTRLAFFYIPLSFTTSFFGMNFRQFGTGELSIWVWFAASFPIFVISVLFLAFDMVEWTKGLWQCVKKRCATNTST